MSRPPRTRLFLLSYLALVAAVTALHCIPGCRGWAALWALSPALGFSLLATAGMRWTPLVLAVEILRAVCPNLRGADLFSVDSVLTAGVVTTFNASGAAILRKLARGRPRLDTANGLNWFLLVTLFIPLGAAAADLGIRGFEGQGLGELLERFRLVWAGGASGLLAIAPAFLVVLVPAMEGSGPRLFSRAQAERAYPMLPLGAEISGQLLALGAALFMIFGLGQNEGAHLLFALFPPLIWIAFAYGLPLASLTMAVTLVLSTIIAEAAGLLPQDLPFLTLALLVATASSLAFGTYVSLQRKAERSRMEQEEGFRRLAQAAFEGIVIHEHGKIVQVNSRLAEMIGLTIEEILGLDVLSFVAPEHRTRAGEMISSGYEGTYEVDAVPRDGVRFPVEICGKAFTQSKKVVRVAAIRDITERRGAEEALRESEMRYRALTEQAPDGVLLLDLMGSIAAANSRTSELLGYSEQELLAMRFEDLLRPEDLGDLPTQLAILRSGRALTIVRQMIKKNTARIHVEFSASKVGDRIQAILRDVTERKLVEEALRESESRYRALFNHMLSGFALHEIVLDDQGHPKDYVFQEINPAFEEMTGLQRARVLGRRVTEVLPGIDDGTTGWIETYAKVALTGESARFEQHSKELDRWYLVFAYCPQHRYFVTLFHDITEEKRAEAERRKLEERIQHGQKMESLGILAGGVAHDFNNLLVGVLANAGLAKRQLSTGSPVLHPLLQIEQAAQRAADLTEQMLAYSGKGQFQISDVDLSKLAAEVSTLLQAVLSSKASLIMELQESLPPVRADATQLRQIVMNLLTNASDALGDEAGEIHLRTGVMEANEAFLSGAWPGEEHPPGSYVWLEIQDNGCGMDEETRTRIFDPFFSTKFTGRGLGLAAVLGIVRGHQGTLEVTSEAGTGTTFRILLPEGPPREVSEEPSSRPAPYQSRGGTILVVDDDDAVRHAMHEILDMEGFKVFEAVDGVDALERYAEHADEIDAVILDLTMPRKDGVAAFKDLRNHRSDLPILLSSGFGESAVDRLPSRTRAGYLRKPYTPSELLEAVNALLEGDSA